MRGSGVQRTARPNPPYHEKDGFKFMLFKPQRDNSDSNRKTGGGMGFSPKCGIYSTAKMSMIFASFITTMYPVRL